LDAFAACLRNIHTDYRIAFGSEQQYVTELSVRKMLGIEGPRTDEVTGEELSPGHQFRMLVLRNENLDAENSLRVKFSTNLQPGNGLWSTDVCSDRVSGLQAQLVGDFLGDNQAQVNISLSGAAVMARCDSEDLNVWSMGSGTGSFDGYAVVQAGVNTFGLTQANTSLFGQAVARASWQIVVPSGRVAPSNADVDLSKLEDIVLRIEHKALPRRSTPLNVDLSCLGAVN
jgi:hypothetical protein